MAVTRLHPAVRLLWRAPGEAQFELGHERIVVSGVGHHAARRLTGQAEADPDDPAEPAIAAAQRDLLDAGMLWPGDAPPADDPLRTPPRPRLDPELTALAVRAGERAAELLQARRHCAVSIVGNGRLGPHLATLLGAAGVGTVSYAEPGTTLLHHAVPGGVTAGDEGRPLTEAAQSAIRRHAPGTRTIPPTGQPPDLVVLAGDGPLDHDRVAPLHERGVAHLVVTLTAAGAAVGPLVIPGLTSCVGCADLHRTDRDPAWSALAVQLSLPHRGTRASEVALATMAAGLSAMQALDFLDGGRPATVEGTLELHPPDWRIRRRSWPVHPRCACMSSGLRDDHAGES